jgi:hypothetical protein
MCISSLIVSKIKRHGTHVNIIEPFQAPSNCKWKLPWCAHAASTLLIILVTLFAGAGRYDFGRVREKASTAVGLALYMTI